MLDETTWFTWVFGVAAYNFNLHYIVMFA